MSGPFWEQIEIANKIHSCIFITQHIVLWAKPLYRYKDLGSS